MSNHTGLSPNNPLKYTGANVYLSVVVTRNREPTGADYRQPETGNLYVFGTIWIIGKDPTTGVQGDFWYLSKIVANVGYWVKLVSAVAGPIFSIGVDANTAPGTDPVLPIAGVVTITGGQVASGVVGANVIRTDSLAAGQLTIEIQRSGSSAAQDTTLNGVAHFNSAEFTVSNGFVSLIGGGLAVDSFQVQSLTAPGVNPVTPLAGVVTVSGAVVANHSVVLETRSRALHAYNLEVQYATTAGATDGTKSGVSHYNSAQFTVDGSGFVSLIGGGAAIETITGNDAIAEVPLAGNFNIIGAGSITVLGSANTETVQLTGLTNHAVLVGAGTTTITKVGPTATVGQVLQSAGAAADPAFSTATYPLTTTVSQILYSSATNTVTGLATANSATLVTTSAGVPVFSSSMTNGQMIIGSTGATPVAGIITSTGGTITVTPGAGTLNLEVLTGGFAWTDVTSATQAMAVENGYITDRTLGVVYTLPATAALGSEIIVMGKLGITTITPNANQQILLSSASGTVGVTGTIVGTNVGDCITLIATTSGASTVWRAQSFVGNWTVN